jgi:hypothetical protein
MNARTTVAQREVAPPPADRAPRLLPGRGAVPVLLTEHLAQHGDPPYDGSRRLIRVLRDAGLTGRDGTGRLVHAEMMAVADAGLPGRPPVVYAHAAQGEPASAKDTTLLWHSPQLVFDGLQLAAAAVGASHAFLFIKYAPNGKLREFLRHALADRARDGFDPVPAQLTEVPPRFLFTDPDENRDQPTLVFEPGTGEVPALVQNVETLAHVALIARYGAAWFRALGRADDPGTMLCTVRQPDGGTDIVEVPTGTLIGDIVMIDQRTQAVLVGGYHGFWLQTWQAAPMPLSTAVPGLFAALPADRCGLAETARVARYLASASPRRHPDGTIRFIRSALRVFSDELRRHEQGGCRATTDRPFLPVTLGKCQRR